MKQTIQEQISKEMTGMTMKECLDYIKRQVKESRFADEIRRSRDVIQKAGNY
jgi:hypothetical protein